MIMIKIDNFMIDAGEAFFEFDRFRTVLERYNGLIPLLWAVETLSVYHQFISQYTTIIFFSSLDNDLK